MTRTRLTTVEAVPENGSFLFFPIYMSPTGRPGKFSPRMLSGAIGYQSGKVATRRASYEFEMRFNLALTNFGRDRVAVSNFNFRFNLVPGTGDEE